MQTDISTPLAIATVPIQTLDTSTLYDCETALKKGTIFAELNKPFFAAEHLDSFINAPINENTTEEEKLLLSIMCISFMLDDLTLFLDTHESNAEAIALFQDNLQHRTKLMEEFSQKFYPLSKQCILNVGKDPAMFPWAEGPMPWEGGCI